MRPVTIATADALHAFAATRRIKYHAVSHESFGRFTKLLHNLAVKLGQLELWEDDHWSNAMWTLRRFRSGHSAAPLAFDDPALLTELARKHSYWLQQAVEAYPPDLAEVASQAFTALDTLRVRADNPLLTELQLIGPELGDRPLVILRQRRLVEAVRSVIAAQPGFSDVTVYAVQDLTPDVLGSSVVVFGPFRWYPDSIFAAPHAPTLHVIAFSWHAEEWRGRPSFLHQGNTGESVSGTVSRIDTYEDPWPQVDWQAIERRARRSVAAEHAGEQEPDSVEARLFVLDDELAVYLDADEASTVGVLEVAGTTVSVERLPTRAVQAGMFVLLRTEGGGDYIVPVADQILGIRAEVVRTAQKFWKTKLRMLVVRQGLSKVSKRLRELGSKRANEQNVRNWTSPRTIRTQDRSDFNAIMELVGESVSSEHYWNLMDQIDEAHRRAGHYIRKLLLDKVRAASPEELLVGRIHFELEGAGGGCITAFRVEEVAPATASVPAALIATPFSMEPA